MILVWGHLETISVLKNLKRWYIVNMKLQIIHSLQQNEIPYELWNSRSSETFLTVCTVQKTTMSCIF